MCELSNLPMQNERRTEVEMSSDVLVVCPTDYVKLIVDDEATKVKRSPEVELCTTSSMPSSAKADLFQQLYQYHRVEDVCETTTQKCHIVPQCLLQNGKKMGSWVYICASTVFHTWFDGITTCPVIRATAVDCGVDGSTGRRRFNLTFDCSKVDPTDARRILPLPSARRDSLTKYSTDVLVLAEDASLFAAGLKWREECILQALQRMERNEKVTTNDKPRGSAWYKSLDLPSELQRFAMQPSRASSRSPKKSKKTES